VCDDIRMKTYCKKMKVLSIGRVSKHAVISLLKKKYAGTINLIFAFLSILTIIVLNDCLASLILRISNRLNTSATRMIGSTKLIMRTKYDMISATLRPEVLLFPSKIFITAKKVVSKYTSMYKRMYAL